MYFFNYLNLHCLKKSQKKEKRGHLFLEINFESMLASCKSIKELLFPQLNTKYFNLLSCD